MTDFYKFHGLGNDYLVMEPAVFAAPPSPEAIRLICHRHLGIGSDGILWGPIGGRKAPAVRIFNPDGSEAEKSGNGLRIFARFLWQEGRVKPTRFPIVTAGGRVEAEILRPDGGLIAVEMGQVTFRTEAIPMAGADREVLGEILEVGGEKLAIHGAGVGNPHCVVKMEREPDEALARRLGPLLENHPLFPNRTNVQFVHPAGPHDITIRIWERGAGYTEASGSSSCAAAAVAVRMGWAASPVTVQMPGGSLLVELDGQFNARQTGPVAFVGQGRLSDALLEEAGLIRL